MDERMSTQEQECGSLPNAVGTKILQDAAAKVWLDPNLAQGLDQQVIKYRITAAEDSQPRHAARQSVLTLIHPGNLSSLKLTDNVSRMPVSWCARCRKYDNKPSATMGRIHFRSLTLEEGLWIL